MMPASTNGGGQCLGAPDVCKTPTPVGTIPIPYPSIGMVNQAQGTSTHVKAVGKPAVTTNSKIPQSTGDEAGTAGGVVSGMNMGEVAFKKGSSKVKADGHPWAHLTSITAHNGSNANMPAGAQIAPSQTKVLVMP